LFFKIQHDLDSSWTGLHSLGLGNHRTKPWTETDFVLIGPQGIYCIEVKGGRVIRHEGHWSFIDRYESANAKPEGPFAQAGGASSALYKFLKDRFPEIKNSVVGFGVATPDISFTAQGPDIINDVVYDGRDATRNFKVYVDRIASYWHQRLHGADVATRNLSPITCDRIKEELRGDFDLQPSLRAQMGLAQDQLHRLTTEQYKVVDGLVDNQRAMIRGGAGTGKSLLATREARRMSRQGDRLLVCCFNRQLALHLSSSLADCKSVTVANLHAFMAQMVAKSGLQYRLPSAEPTDLFQVYYPELCTEILLDNENLQFDSLIIDEGQDLLREPNLDVFDALLRGGLKHGRWRVFFDPNQDIYRGQQPQAIQRLLLEQPAQFRLSVNCRNTRPIAVTTSMLASTPCEESLAATGPEVEKRWYSNPKHQTRQISNKINTWLGAGVKSGEITILSRRRMENSCLALGLPDVPLPVVNVIGENEHPSGVGRLGFSTIAGFKGLESDAVILADIDDLTSTEGREMIYVGTSRAKTLLAIFLAESVRHDYDECAFRYGELLAKGGSEA
jgi:hypothetical protein